MTWVVGVTKKFRVFPLLALLFMSGCGGCSADVYVRSEQIEISGAKTIEWNPPLVIPGLYWQSASLELCLRPSQGYELSESGFTIRGPTGSGIDLKARLYTQDGAVVRLDSAGYLFRPNGRFYCLSEMPTVSGRRRAVRLEIESTAPVSFDNIWLYRMAHP